MASGSALDLWLDGLESAPSVVLEAGTSKVLVFEAPLRFRSDAPDDTQTLLAPLIARSLPGYGDSAVPSRCLVNSSRPVVFTDRNRFIGFLACNETTIDKIDIGYLTLTALDPDYQGRGLLKLAVAHLIASWHYSILSATTNVPELYALLEWFSIESAPERGPIVFPRLVAEDATVPPPLNLFGRKLLASVLGKPLEGVSLDSSLVRRQYRSRDLQADPMHVYLQSRIRASDSSGRHRAGEVAKAFLDVLHLGVGDAALVLAALDDRLGALIPLSD